MPYLRLVLCGVLLVGVAGPAAAQGGPPPAAADQEWPQHGNDAGQQRFARLRGLDTRNVQQLVLRRVFQHGQSPAGAWITTPIVREGTLYASLPYSGVVAWDLRSGATRWSYVPKLGSYQSCCGPVNRGVAVADARVFVATLDARVVALDRATGEPLWEVQDSDPDSAYAFTMAPLVVDSLVIVGTSGAEYATRGRLTAYHVATGRRVWRFFTVPSPNEGGWWGSFVARSPWGDDLGRDLARERADSARYADAWRTGGGAVWTTPSYDPAERLIVFGTGNPVPEYDPALRPGDNLYTGSLVALDVGTGKLRWYHQYLPHDVGDLDAANPPIIATVQGRRVVLHAGKTGYVYLLDLATGAPIRRSGPFVPEENARAAPTDDGIRRSPGAGGGADWHPSAWSPETGLLYTPMMHMPFVFTRFAEERVAGRLYRGGAEKSVPIEETWAGLVAMDPATGREAWRRIYARGDHRGGVLATSGGLVFMGDTDGWFRAYDARTGAERWSFFAGAGAHAPPVAFELDGEPFVAVAAGGSFYEGRTGDALLVFGLPRAGAVRTPASSSR